MNSIVLVYKEGYIGVGVLTMAFTRTAIALALHGRRLTQTLDTEDFVRGCTRRGYS